jgi:UDP-GlcNAc:undecaprenyl-phosphate GlcNAc-1-phosphate transferase
MSLEQILSPYVWVFYAAFACAFVCTPLMQKLATVLGITDQPDKIRKFHQHAIPYLGGVAIFIGWLMGVVANQIHGPSFAGDVLDKPVVYLALIGAGVVVVLAGLWDDVWRLGPRGKIGAQLFASAILLAQGVGIHSARPALMWLIDKGTIAADHVSPLAGGEPLWFTILSATASCLLTVCVIVGCCNSTNLMDGLDGLCGGVTAIIAAGFLFVCAHVAMSGMSGGRGDAARLVMSLAVLGAVLGFLPFNFSPASIFMGDTGSMFLGYCCGTMMLMMAEVQSKWFLAAMVMFALPILDTCLAFARRWIAGRPLFSADAQHFHHQLMARGLSVKKTVLISYLLTIVFAAMGVAMVFMRQRFAVAAYMVIFAFVGVAAFKMGMLHERLPGKRPRDERFVPGGSINGVVATVDQPGGRLVSIGEPPGN